MIQLLFLKKNIFTQKQIIINIHVKIQDFNKVLTKKKEYKSNQ